VQGPDIFTMRKCIIGSASLFQGLFGQECNNGVYLRVNSLDLCKVSFHHLSGG
jgi:hypothetical protein